MRILLVLLVVASSAFGQISFEPIRLYDDTTTWFELTDMTKTHDGNLMIAWTFFTSERGGSKVHVFSPEGEPIGEPIAAIDVPLDELFCTPDTRIGEREGGAWATLTIYS